LIKAKLVKVEVVAEISRATAKSTIAEVRTCKDTMTKACLEDVTLWRWRFFIFDRDELSIELLKFKHEFEQFFLDAARWTKGKRVQPDWPPRHRLGSPDWQLYRSSDWQKSDGTARWLEAHVLLDAWYIQSGYEEEGARGPEVVLRLKQAERVWAERSLASSAFVTVRDAICISAELTEEIGEDRAKDLTAEILGVRNAAQEVELVQLTTGFLGTVKHSDTEQWVFLSPREPEYTRFLHDLMPPLMLARTKWRFVVDDYEKLWQEAHKNERIPQKTH
jgi:hypothetical protein